MEMLSLPVFNDQTQFFVIRIHGQFGLATGAVRVATEEIEAVLSLRFEPQNLVAQVNDIRFITGCPRHA
jgi:hypothetical protein